MDYFCFSLRSSGTGTKTFSTAMIFLFLPRTGTSVLCTVIFLPSSRTTAIYRNSALPDAPGKVGRVEVLFCLRSVKDAAADRHLVKAFSEKQINFCCFPNKWQIYLLFATFKFMHDRYCFCSFAFLLFCFPLICSS